MSLAAHLRQRTDWRKLVFSGERVAEFDRTGWAPIPPDQAEALNIAVYATAWTGFQFRFDRIRVSDAVRDRAADTSPIGGFVRWIPTARASMGRNEPCWRLSGDKWKKCHMDREAMETFSPFEVEADWL